MVLIYVAVVLAALGVWMAARAWRKRHPPKRTPQEVFDSTPDEFKKGSSLDWPWGVSGGGP